MSDPLPVSTAVNTFMGSSDQTEMQAAMGTSALSWTRTTGSIGDGLFTTNSGDFSATTTITLAKNTITTGGAPDFPIPVNTRIVLTGAGLISTFLITAVVIDGSNNIQLAVTLISTQGSQWGVVPYAVSFISVEPTGFSGTVTNPTSITVVNGIVTDVS